MDNKCWIVCLDHNKQTPTLLIEIVSHSYSIPLCSLSASKFNIKEEEEEHTHIQVFSHKLTMLLVLGAKSSTTYLQDYTI
jgi:hypothetical protein